MKEKTILKLNSSQNDLFEITASRVNDKYFYFPKIYIKTSNPNEFEEVEYSSLPEGIQKYLSQKMLK